MYHEFTGILARMGLWNDSGPVLLAVSGGIDSMCMADLFRRTGLPFAVAHCNFHLRGSESDGDEALVREWARKNGVKFHLNGFDTAAFASGHGISIEMAARELRYAWFSDLCRSEHYCALCVAHNANDNVETLFLNIVRGTGLKGLSGMAEDTVVPYGDENVPVRLLRPLLTFTRSRIEGYVRKYSIGFREDRTNAMTDYKRNKIRHLVFPVLEEMNPSFFRTVSEEMLYFAQAGAIADSYFDSVSADIVTDEDGTVSLDLAGLMALEHWEYVLYRFMDRFGFHKSAVVSLTSLLKSDRTFAGKIFESQEYMVTTASGKLMIRASERGVRRKVMQSFDTDSSIFTAVRGAGTYFCNGMTVSVSVVDRSSLTSLKQPSGTLLFDASLLRFPFALRVWRDGDWFVPFGMKGRKKVSDFFTDLKYDICRKASSVMLVDTSDRNRDEHRIAAVVGERIDDRYRITPETGTVVVVKVEDVTSI